MKTKVWGQRMSVSLFALATLLPFDFTSATTLYLQPEHDQVAYTAPASTNDDAYWTTLRLSLSGTGQPLYWWLYATLPQPETLISFNPVNTPPTCTVRFEETPVPGWVRAYTIPYCENARGARLDIPTYAASATLQVAWLGALGNGGTLYGGGTEPPTCKNEITGTMDACAVPPSLFITDDAAAVPEPAVPVPYNDAATHLAGTYYQGYTFTRAASPYIIDGPVYIRSGVVTFEPGVVVKFRNTISSLTVHGDASFVSNGTANEPVFFTSYKDDAHGGDTNGDGAASQPHPGDWGYLSIGCGAVALGDTRDHIRVYYGGALQQGTSETYALMLCDGRTLADPFASRTTQHIEVAHNLNGLMYANQAYTGYITDSSVHDNNGVGATALAGPGYGASYFTGNWWGNSSGPRSADNPGGSGDLVLGSGPTVPFLTEDPFPATPPPPAACTPGQDPDCNSNVLFLPGIEASRMYYTSDVNPYTGTTSEVRAWEPSSDLVTLQLSLDTNGKSVRPDVYTRDVLDEAYALEAGPNIYKSFLDKMGELKTEGKIADFTAVPYDWRLSLADIVSGGTKTGDNISYLAPSQQPFVMAELLRMASSSRTGKVTVVAHSNGGLVIKALLTAHPELNQYVDRIIMVDVPQVGTPAALAALLHGQGQGLPLDTFPLLLTPQTARAFAHNAPFAYNLVPSFGYFSTVFDPVLSFDPATMPDYVSRYGSSIILSGQLTTVLNGSYMRVAPDSTDLQSLTQANDTLLAQAAAAHASLDAWTPPAGMELIQIAGWGIPTLKGLEYASTSKPLYCLTVCEYGFRVTASTTIDGDGTVVVPSQLWMSDSLPGVKNYWVNLSGYNNDHPFSTAGGVLKINHKNILEVPQLNMFISDAILNLAHSLSYYQYLSLEAPTTTDVRLRYSLRSPLTLDLYDNEGRHTGISTTTGQIEEQIPGTYYSELAGVKYLYADASSSARIIMVGYDTGPFTLEIEQYIGDSLTASTTFRDIPATPNTIASISIQSDVSTLSPLAVDENGDGTTDIELAPKQNGTVTMPLPLTVTADNKTMVLHGTMPPLTATISGFVNGDTATSSTTGAPVCVTTATASSTPGAYPITCTIGTLTSDHYAFTSFVAGTLTIQYRCDGFGDPINDHGHHVKYVGSADDTDQPGANLSIFKAGSTIPVKFSLLDASGVVQIATTSPIWYAPVRGGSMSKSVDESVFSEPSTTGAFYALSGAQWRYNWSTKSLSSGYWYRVYAKLGNGQVCSVTVGLR